MGHHEAQCGLAAVLPSVGSAFVRRDLTAPAVFRHSGSSEMVYQGRRRWGATGDPARDLAPPGCSHPWRAQGGRQRLEWSSGGRVVGRCTELRAERQY